MILPVPGRVSVVIPAHNEAALIGNMITHLLADDHDERLQIVVVANGCTDDTAAQATAASPRVTVIETPRSSKTAALNIGDAHAEAFPRAYVDADVTVSAAAVVAVADALAAGEALAASPRFVPDLSRSSRWTRAFYRAWLQSPYHDNGHIGSGFFAVSEHGRRRWTEFPDIIADDRYVELQFDRHERLTLDSHVFTVPAPRRLRDHIRRSIRIEIGNRLVHARDDIRSVSEAHAGALGRLLLRTPLRAGPVADAAVFAVTKAFIRWRVNTAMRRGEQVGWNRDESTRQGPPSQNRSR